MSERSSKRVRGVEAWAGGSDGRGGWAGVHVCVRKGMISYAMYVILNICFSPPKPTRTVVMNLRMEAVRSLQLSSTTRMPVNINNVLPGKTLTSNIDLSAHRSKTLRRIPAVSAMMQISSTPAQIRDGLTDSSSSKILNATSDIVSSVKSEPPQSSISGMYYY